MGISELYRDLFRHPAWQDYQGFLIALRDQFEAGILRGDRDSAGVDVTPYLRAGYALLIDLTTFPEKIEARRNFVEVEFLHVKPTQPPEWGSAPTA